MRSLPVWGEWIEMLKANFTPNERKCLSPCGESGLKLDGKTRDSHRKLSLPVWGEWIEMPMYSVARSVPTVSPRVGRVD